jgi:membrane protein DedA with SNARE-associated domain
VEELLRHLLEGASGTPAYLIIFGVLLLCGLGLPLPEDISLILGGYIAYSGGARLSGMIAVGFLGILCGDSLIYLAGRRFGDRVASGKGFFTRIVARIVTPEKRARVEKLFQGHGEKIVMLARFLPGVRAVTYFTAGSAGLSYLRFIMFDGLAALASAPLLVYVGYRFGGELEMVVKKIRDGQIAVIAAIVAGVAGYFLLRRWRASVQKREEQAAEQNAAAAAVPAPAQLPSSSPPPAPRGRVSDATSG